MKIYHGSNIEVRHPKILTNGHYKDFGYGFYCTHIQKQAEDFVIDCRKSVSTIKF